MRARLPPSSAASVAAAAALIAALPAVGDTPAALFGIQRCQSREGNVVYTDRGCAASGARPTPLSHELVSRIAYDSTLEHTAPMWLATPEASAFGAVPVRRPPLAGCARTPRQLSLDLQGSLALHDVNRLAESFHWVGMSHRQGQHVMDRLQRLTDRPVQRAQYFDAQIGPADMVLNDTAKDTGSAGIVQLLLADEGSGASIVDLDVRRYSGCYFVSFQPG